MNGVVELMESAQAVMPPFIDMPVKRGCRGEACPLFAVCQGRCKTKVAGKRQNEQVAGR